MTTTDYTIQKREKVKMRQSLFFCKQKDKQTDRLGCMDAQKDIHIDTQTLTHTHTHTHSYTELRFVATVTTDGRVKFVPAV